jgi:Kelch motif
VVLAVIALAIVIAAGGTSRRPGTRTGPSRLGSTAAANGTTPKVVLLASGQLLSPVQDAAAAAIGPDSALLLGGLDQSEASVADIVRVMGLQASRIGMLPMAVHDASASTLAGQVYLFGGGENTSFSSITGVSNSGGTRPAGQLPSPASDLAAAVISGTAYIVGGYTGQAPLRTILAWRAGSQARQVGLLPKPLRYAAVAEQDGQVVIAGGTSGVAASRVVYRFDPRRGRVTVFARLPTARTHAAAATLNGTVFVFGGRGANPDSQTSSVLAISPSGVVSVAGALPEPLSDLSAVALGDHILVAGGRNRSGHVSSALLALGIRK